MKQVNYEPLSPLLFLERAKRVYKDKIAIIDKNVRKTYEEFYNDCVLSAKSFKQIGVTKNNKVAYLCRNNHYMLEAYYSIPMIGGVVIPINIRLNDSDIIYILKHSEAKILIVEEDLFKEDYLKIVEKVIVISNNNYQNCLKYSEFIKLGESLESFECDLINENDLITINYTSGTTGLPKGVMYTHRGTYLNSLGECLEVGLNSKSTYLWVLPMFHCNGWCFTWAVTAAGGTHVCLDKTCDIEHLINLIIKNNVTHFCAVPTILIKLLESPNFNSLKDVSNLKIITAGSSPSPTLIKKYEESNINILHVYGLTETYGPHAICLEQESWSTASKDEVSYLKCSQGLPGIHSLFIRVVDKNMQDVPHDGKTVGEVIMRGNNVMLGYYKDKENTEKAFQDGWFHSGDAAVIKPNGYIEIRDRIKDIIISGGENISSIEIENIIYQHPSVSIVAVIPKYDEVWGEVPHAIIELKNGHILTEEEIIKHCRDNLSHFKCPKIVTFTTIPKTSTGKIQKYILKQQYYKPMN